MGNFVFGACQCKEEDLKQSSLNSITTSIVANKTKDTQKSLENTKEDNINGSGNKDPMAGMEYYNILYQRIIASSEINQNIEHSLVLGSTYQ